MAENRRTKHTDIEAPTNPLSPSEKQVLDIQSWRRSESDRLVKEGKTLNEILQYFDNNYAPLERLYFEKTGCELNADPYEAARYEIPISKSCSIVIPTYNAGLQLENTLRAIQASSFNAKYPQQLEVIVVDDESPTVNIAELISELNLQDLNIKVLRQSNGREGKARYSGTLEAKGDVMLFTDQDVVYTPTMIEEFMKRHQILGEISCIGFRYDINKEDPKLSSNEIARGSLGEFGFAFNRDQRVTDDAMRDCSWLKDSGNGKPIPINTAADWSWDLPSIGWGFSISAPRETVLKIVGATDERYRGWGGEDHNITAELISTGLYILPNTGAIALHQEHPTRYLPEKAAANRNVLESNLNSSPKRQDPHHPQPTDAKLVFEYKNTRLLAREPMGLPKENPYDHARTLLRMCKYEEALPFFDQAEDEYGGNEWFLYDKGMTLTALGGSDNLEQAIEITRRAVNINPENPWLHLALAEAYARNDMYNQSLSEYREVKRLDPSNVETKFLDGDPLQNSQELHEYAAKNYLKRGKPRAALKYYDRAIVVAGETNSGWSVYDKGIALLRLKRFPEAIKVLERAAQILNTNTWAYLALGEIYEHLNIKHKALSYYLEALKADQSNLDAAQGISRLS